MPETQQTLGLVQRISNIFRKIVEPMPAITTERRDFSLTDARLIELKPTRLAKYKDFDEMDEEIVELSSALDIYSDFVTSAQTGSDDVYNINFEREMHREADIVEAVEDKLGLKERAWFITRNICKYGDAFYENVASPSALIKLKFLPPMTMYVNKVDGQLNQEFPYVQKDPTIMLPIAEFAPWEIIHFKIGDEDYGCDFSVFGKVRRTYRVLRMLEDSLLVTRLVRSGRRGVYEIDVTGMGEAEATEYIRKLKLINRRQLYFSQTGKLRVETNPLQQQEDIYIPVRKGGIGGKYNELSGDPSLGEIRDVLHFHNKLFAATKVPKAYLGFEHDVNAKATLWQQHVAFVKVVKRYRSAFAEGLKKIYRLNFLINGIDPRSFTWSIKFPAIGSPDEEAAWSIERVKAEVLKIYGEMGILLPVEWIVRKLMLNLSPDEADNLIALMKDLEPPPKPAPPPLAPGKQPPAQKPDVQPGTKPPPESRSLGFVKVVEGEGDGQHYVTKRQLEDLMRQVEKNPFIRQLAQKVEDIIIKARHGQLGDHY